MSLAISRASASPPAPASLRNSSSRVEFSLTGTPAGMASTHILTTSGRRWRFRFTWRRLLSREGTPEWNASETKAAARRHPHADGKTLLTGSRDTALRFRDLAPGEPRYPPGLGP